MIFGKRNNNVSDMTKDICIYMGDIRNGFAYTFVGGKFKNEIMSNLGLSILMILFFSFKLHGQENRLLSNDLDTIIYKISDLDSIPRFIYPKGNCKMKK